MLLKSNIKKYLKLLNDELQKKGAIGEIYMVGGAVMCLVFNARESTKDIDAIFAPKDIIRECAVAIASEYNLPKDWLTDAVKGFMSGKGAFDDYIEYNNLRVFTASTEYLLAMKCMSMRIGESEDINDVKFLIDKLSIKSSGDVFEIISKFYPEDKIPIRTSYALEEIFAEINKEFTEREVDNETYNCRKTQCC